MLFNFLYLLWSTSTSHWSNIEVDVQINADIFVKNKIFNMFIHQVFIL